MTNQYHLTIGCDPKCVSCGIDTSKPQPKAKKESS